MYQRIIIVGNLGRDPEMRYTPQGTPVTQFQVATSRRWTGADSALHEETAWFRCTTWGKQAEICNQYLSKGKKVLVEGQLVVDEKTGGPRLYRRRDDTVGASFEVRATLVRFLSPKGEGSTSRAESNSNEFAHADAMGMETVGESGSMSEEELPF